MYSISKWERSEGPYAVGDLVKCYDTYADGIVRGTDTGIVLAAQVYQLPYREHMPAQPAIGMPGYTSALIESYAGTTDTLTTERRFSNNLNYYMIYRFGSQSTCWCEDHNLEIISKAENKQAAKAKTT